MRVTSWQAVIPLGVAALVLVGALGHARIGAASPRVSDRAAQSATIDHVKPRRDSSGPIPDRLEWTAVKGADSYSLGVWNEVDVMIWKQGNLKTNSVAWPKDLVVDSGTYFWSVLALRNGEPIAESGLAAFIVVR
jgi:hypothetical protein